MKWNPELYSDKHAFVYKLGEDLIALLDPKENERILDVGCGSGQLTSKIRERAKDVTGIDKSPEMIAVAKSKFKNIHFEIADAANFAFREKFDSIFSNATLHWVTDYLAAIHCMYQNLKTNGRIVLEFGGKGNIQTIENQLKGSLAKRGHSRACKIEQWYFPSIGEYALALESVGFRVLMAQHFDRMTELADEQSGIKDWVTMFAEKFFHHMGAGEIDEIKTEVQEKVKSTLLVNGKWHADYKRIRIVAVKE